VVQVHPCYRFVLTLSTLTFHKEIHDPGLTPRGKEEARQFPQLYEYHIKPTLVVSSPLRRCLQTTAIAFGPMIHSGELRALAHPGLQEISNDICDTGTPLDDLRREFPEIQFRDELFPQDAWPRSDQFEKSGTIYANKPTLLRRRAVEFREWLRDVEDTEIIVVTHGGFVHFLYDDWRGFPGESWSNGVQLENAEALPMTLPGPQCEDGGFRRCPWDISVGASYVNLCMKDAPSRVKGDFGMFTPASFSSLEFGP